VTEPRSEPIAEFLSRLKPLNCDEGRRLGCHTFCCSLIVRLEPGECDPTMPNTPMKNCIDKHPHSGICIHLDQERGHCRIYRERPNLCRQYDCRRDPLLPVVLEYGFNSLVDLIKRTEK
jgi:uncharacterized protein